MSNSYINRNIQELDKLAINLDYEFSNAIVKNASYERDVLVSEAQMGRAILQGGKAAIKGLKNLFVGAPKSPGLTGKIKPPKVPVMKGVGKYDPNLKKIQFDPKFNPNTPQAQEAAKKLLQEVAKYESRQAAYLKGIAGTKTKLTAGRPSDTLQNAAGTYDAKTGTIKFNPGATDQDKKILERMVKQHRKSEAAYFARLTALNNLQPKIIDLAAKRGFSETAKKAAKNIAGFTVLYYIFSGGSKPTVAGGDKATQEVVTVATEGVQAEMLSVDEINESISTLKSALQNLPVPENQKPRIREHISKLSDIATALEACKQPVSTDQFGGFSEKIKNAEAKINAYLPILEKVTAHLEAKYPEQGNLAVEVLENLQMFLDSIKSTRQSMKSEG